MKKIIAIIIILQITTNSFSQISYGIAGGINISHVTEKTNGRPTFTSDSKVRPNFGAFVQIPVGGNIIIQPELHYSMLGYKADSANITAGFNLDYITIPINIKYKFHNGLGLFAGAQLGILVNEKFFINNSSIKTNIYKNTDFSFVLGADYTFRSGISLSLSSQLGIANILKENPILNNVTSILTASTITVGYILGKNKKQQ
jgi:hypothetical protein